jgi:hypothetical protein
MPSKDWLDKHVQVTSWLPLSYQARLTNILGRYGYSFSAWLRAMIDRCDAERLPESQGGLKKVIDPAFARAAADALIREAELRRELADRVYARTKDLSERDRIRREAEQLDDYAALALEWLDEINMRESIIEQGIRQPRHRYKQGRRAGA